MHTLISRLVSPKVLLALPSCSFLFIYRDYPLRIIEDYDDDEWPTIDNYDLWMITNDYMHLVLRLEAGFKQTQTVLSILADVDKY